MTEREKKKIEYVVAQLRHAHFLLLNNLARPTNLPLFANGLIAPQIEILEYLLSDSSTSTKYQIGDFVEFYEGMGETGHGEIEKYKSGIYQIRVYFAGVPQSYTRQVTKSDMRGLSTIEKELEYEKIRSS